MASDIHERVTQILDRYMDRDFSLFTCGENAPTEEEVSRFEDVIGFKLPDDFRNFSMSALGGLYIDVKEEIWPRAKVFAVGPFWSFLYGMYVYGFGKDIPEWMDIRAETKRFKKDTKHKVVPCLKIVGDADFFCFDSDGKLKRWQHEEDSFEDIEMGFLNLFEAELKALKERKEWKKSERRKK